MNLRQQAKQKTRDKIYDKTALLLYKQGFLKVSSKEIALESEVSQGTIFLHFNTKDNLLASILVGELLNFENDLKIKCDVSLDSDEFVKLLIDCIVIHEDILSRVFKDFGYLPEDLKKHINNMESTIKNLFFENIRSNASKRVNIVDSFVSIDAFYSQIVKYLVEKEIYSSSNSIIKQKRGRLVKLHRMLFE